MKPWRQAITSILAFAAGAALLMSPMAALASTPEPALDSNGLTFTNPSFINDTSATPGADATPMTALETHGGLLGNPDAPVTLQIYADYQCPHCRAFHIAIEPQLIADYVVPGEIRLEFIDFPVIGIKSIQDWNNDEKESVQAAEATMCAAEQDAFMMYREALYTGDLKPNSGVLSDENLGRIADNLGLDADALSSCLASGRYEEAIVSQALAALEAGVQQTPSMAIDGEIIVIPQSGYEGLQATLDEAIARSR